MSPPAAPIETLPLFAELDRLLLELLRSLTPADWQRPTLALLWTVKDVAAHLLDGNLRTLSMLRDGHFGETPDDFSYAGMVAYLNRLNADWVRAMRRLSPAVLVDWLTQSGAEYTAYLHTLDPWGPAAWPVAWAGETESKNWFHIARDYTEKWHHQQQIREAVGQTAPLLTPALFRPFIETLMRGLPHAYRAVEAPAGTRVRMCVQTAAGGTWELLKTAENWHLAPPAAASPAAEISLEPEVAWRLFTKGLSAAQAEPLVQLAGEERLAKAALGLVAVMG
ncbi:maleylpyruvate isomerase N-terminal domain-containing protein [Hymenobacter properus]|uniref:Maleylpyruvate isomerase N-terminal domain-containing protein n=1 Tax=Hymenobacter properus TaxID=2791026 RepID=A0A931BI18_9BACT|nr:maleylpyruvate isomerase N-terminal domain-containing protein [Hymenobacter properus]MBF9141956.1 maleylpyruvate isomerase N-terminal domain-containing protein [Hymenobacter properus]MBR7720763.1 maleylpyruvate isomerase N-terminal domain-containing protein [Microvirga sp. SRT04]